MLKKINIKLIFVVFLSVLTASFYGAKSVYADCESTYGGGENCIYNKSFRIVKDVRTVNDNSNGPWKDKVSGVDKNDTLEFRSKVTNVGEVKVDEMKMKDYLPDELKKLDGGDGLTEEWGSFAPGETKEFTFKVKVKDSEFDRENFEKCIVNKAELHYKDAFEGADTATVCYSKGELKELPETGTGTTVMSTIAGIGLIALGIFTKKRFA
jgi:LPXTG-motif cell wall-anchored protein